MTLAGVASKGNALLADAKVFALAAVIIHIGTSLIVKPDVLRQMMNGFACMIVSKTTNAW